MNNLYYNQMVELLLAHPEGIRVGRLVRAIYNANCDLFTADTSGLLRSIHKQVYQHLWREQRKHTSPFQRTKWGVYALRPHFVMQLELCFDDWENDDVAHQPRPAERKPEAYMRDLFG